MKKIFTHLFALFLLSLVTTSNVWAQETTEISLNFSEGTCNSTDGVYCYSWTSTTDPAITVSVGNNKNNLVVNPSSGNFEMHEGASGSTWTFSVTGYRIVSYSFTYKTKQTGNDVTITIGETTYTSSDSEQSLEIAGLDSPTASFSLSGSNTGVVVSNLKLNVYKHSSLTALEEGQVYMFENARAARSLRANGTSDVHVKATDANDTAQQWYVTKENGYYVLRNVACGKYLKGALSSNTSWGMTDDYSATENKFELHTSNYETLNTLKTNGSDGYGYMHDDNNGDNGGYNVVGWLNGAGNTGTHWTITKVDYTAEQITALLEKAPTVAESAAYVTSLEAIFSDAACTILNSAYTTTSMTDEQLAADASYSALPQTLKNMVKKVRNDEWSEATIAPADRPNGNNNTNHSEWTVEDTWGHEYAKKFRVQMYEPYSVEGEITTFLGINAHCNMDNPTGIYANAGESIYIMVEGDIAEGAELWVAHQTGHGVTSYYNNAAYTQLKKGLNVIPYASDGCQLWINYLVHTYNTSTGEFPYKLSDYKPLKIHIEGGHINGFFNAMGDFRSTEVTGDANGGENLWGEVDNDADWDYYKARVALATDFALLGHRQTLLFPFGTWNSTNGYFGVANDGGGIEKALAWHLENIEVPTTPNCYAGSGNAFGDFSDTYYPGMNLVTNGTLNKINIMLEAWDRIMYSEHATMGLLSKSNIDKMNSLYPGWTAENTTFDIYNYGSNDTGDTYKAFCEGRDYGDYYNHHGAAVGSGTGYMSGGWRVCNYHYNTMGSIIGKIAKEAGPTWGPAHEIGHQHQAIFNLNGQTEVTNNFFSNVAVWYMGMGTSRVNGTDGSLASVLDAFNTEDNDLYTNNIWAMTHLYYRLWLYYHLAGNNTQFWPRLFELLRQTPMVNGGQISGETSLLRFYQHACDAAGEDLTEFFRAHGFFEIMDNRLVGDYSNATYNVTEEQIETAITAVEANDYPKNYAILLINDGTSDTTVKHDGTSKRALWDGSASAEYGSVTDFIEGNTSVTEAYTAIVGDDGTVTMSGGEGGVGFLVFNENGELVSFSNKSTFELSDEAKKTILQGNATFVAVDSENNTTTAEIDLTAMQRTILAELIAMAQQIVDKIDNTYTKIGFYKGAAVADLAAALENAKTVYDAGTSGYGAAYDLLYAEYNKLLENPDAKIPFDPSLTYIITNKAYTNETMWVNDALTVRSEGGVDQTADAAKWQFKATASDGVYNIYNKKGYYCPAVVQSTAMTATATANADALYTLQEMETGVWAIKLSPAAGYRNFHSSWSNVVGWETGNDASRWYLTAVEPNATIADLTDLEVYITKTEALLGEVLGTVTYTRGENIALQTTTESDPYYIWTNAQEAGEGPIANLVDGATNNYFHTDWHAENISSGDHYIAVDLGADNTLPRFAFSHTTRNADTDHVKSVDVYGCDEKDGIYKYLGSVTGMPQTKSTFWQFDGMIISSHRYLRFNMHANRGYWHMAEFDIMPVTSFTATVNDTYSGIVNVETLTDALEAMYNGKGVVVSTSPAEGDIDAKLEALKNAYNALYTEYSAAITARKNTLAQLVTNTQELIKQAGTVTFAQETPVELNTGNFYCNAPYIASNNADYSAEYVSKLTDGNNSTYLHTRWGANSDDGDYHYLRVDMGEGVSIDKFNFTYTTASRSKKDMPLTMVVEGANEIDGDNTTADTFTEIVTLTSLPEVLNTNTVYNSEVLGSIETPYRYLRFKVTDITVDESDSNGHPFFTMAEFALNSVVEEETTINSTYKSVVTEELLLASVHTTNSSAAMSTNALVTSVPMLDAQIADQQAAYDKLNEAMQKATCDKTELQAAYDNALALYNKMADAEGNVTSNYAPSTLTVEQLAAAKTALDAAKDKLDNSNDQDEIDTAKGNLDTAFGPLNTVESLNVAATKDKSALETLINSANTLLGTINGNIESNENYYAGANGLALAELQAARDAAVDAKDRYYLTEEQYTNVYNTLNSCYTTTNTVVAADVAGRNELTTLIDNVKTLLGTIAEESAPKNVAVPLQSTAADGNFYIWCNAPAGDSQGVAGLIDKNADGTANTGTFLGTSWGSTVAAYTHYIEVDLGEGITIDKLLFDYTTRNSTHSNQRPTAIKILGSNDKTDYTEITIISEGLATEQCQQWSMAETLELGAPYRYIRFAVATQESTGYFNMSDFNLYALIGHTRALKEYYTTAQGLDFEALCMALQSAEYAAEHYLTTDRLTEVKNMLNGYYTAANTIVEADVEAGDRTDLTDLVAETETLIEKVATVTEVEVTLTEGMLYCNADNSTNDSAGDSDKLGVAALLDGDVTTHLHTTYGGNAQDDDLDHYIRVDLGDASVVTAFKFNYKGRQDNSSNAPTNMTVEAGNSIEAGAEWVTLATLSELPTGTAPVSYESELIEMSEAYRYVRFMVSDTYNHDTTTPSGGTAHKFFVMSEFGIEGYPTVEVDENYPRVTTALVRTAYNEKNSANNVATNYYMTESDYNEALAALQADYDALDAAATADKSELEALIDATEALKSQLYKHTYTQGSALALQADNAEQAYYLYCNAPESNASAVDNVGVSALIDSDETNYLHTEWTGDQSADGLDHYLRVDLGEDGKLSDFVFSYKSARDLPRTFVVEGCNTADGEYERIGLYVGANTTNTLITSGLLGNGNEYRYLRFRVIATQSNNKDNSGYHRFFVLNDFDVYPVSNIVATNELKDEYASAIYIYTTTELVTEVTDGITQAQGVVDDASVNQGDVDAEVEALQAVYDKLEEALKYAGVPVEITTDEANPVLYNIISKRAADGSKVLQYCEFDAENPKTVSVSDKTANSSYQAWYFMESAYGVVIKPFNGDGKVLGADNTSNDHTKVWAVAEDEKSYDEWNFVARADAYYNIQAYDGSNYFSNMNGVNYKMGFWSGSPESDEGSLFKFVEAEFENDNPRYYQLSDFENTLEYQTADTPEGTTVGAFTNGDAYSTAYTTASTLIETGNTSATADCYNAYTALRTASENVERIEPEEGKIYRIYITPGYTASDRAGASMRIGDNGKLACGEYAAANTEYYFAFEYDGDGNLYMKNFHSGTYLDEALTSASNNNAPVGADAETIDAAEKIAINTLGKSGETVVVGIVPDGGDMLNCAGKPGNVVAFNNTAVDKASAWVIEEVTDETVAENIKQSVTLNDSNDGNKYSTLYLGYNATIPENVTASIVTGLNELGQLIMRDVAELTGDRILPAKTAVVLSSGTVASAEFEYAETDDEFDTSENVLKGTAYNKLVNCGETYNIYMLGRKNGRVAFYWAYENRNADGNYVYIDANENVVEENVEGAHKNHNKGGYVKCNANKAYLQMSEDTQGQAAAAMFSFYFGDNTSDIESINAVADTYDNVYDLQGRKLEKVTSPGMYIVGGKKVYVTGVE